MFLRSAAIVLAIAGALSAQSSAIDTYRAALARAQSGPAPRTIEPAFVAIDAVEKALMNSAGGKSRLESMTASEFQQMEKQLPGLLISREEIVFVKPDVKFFTRLSESGDAADRAFFAALGATYPDSVWAVYNERQTDYSGCTRFGSMALVDTYRRWSDYQRRFPNRYRARATGEIGDVTNDLTTSTCACGEIASVERELTAFIREFPAATARAAAEARLKAVQAGTSGMRARCKSG